MPDCTALTCVAVTDRCVIPCEQVVLESSEGVNLRAGPYKMTVPPGRHYFPGKCLHLFHLLAFHRDDNAHTDVRILQCTLTREADAAERMCAQLTYPFALKDMDMVLIDGMFATPVTDYLPGYAHKHATQRRENCRRRAFECVPDKTIVNGYVVGADAELAAVRGDAATTALFVHYSKDRTNFTSPLSFSVQILNDDLEAVVQAVATHGAKFKLDELQPHPLRNVPKPDAAVLLAGDEEDVLPQVPAACSFVALGMM
jgi:hypothetical protein